MNDAPADRLEALRVPPSLRPFALRALAAPEPLRALAEMLAVLREKVTPAELLDCAMALNRAAPADPVVRRMAEICVSHRIPGWHWAMVNDGPRNAAYLQAIEANVRPGMTVLEIGAGSGLLAMMAARAGADRVFTVEGEPAVADVARRNIARNGLADRITVIEGVSHELPAAARPPRCDALIHEIMSTDLLSEALLPSVVHAREELLAPGALLLPERVRAIGRLSANPRPRETMRTGVVAGFDLSAINDLARSARSMGDGWSDATLSGPETLLELDLREVPADLRGRVETRFTPERDGDVEGVEQCIGFDFPGGARLGATAHRGSNWGVYFHLFETAVAASAGVPFPVVVDYTPVALALSPGRP